MGSRLLLWQWKGEKMGKQKLELTWVGKAEQPRLEPRILLGEQGKSYHAKFRVSDKDIFDNRLIFGDNLLALKALEQEFTGKVKCIYIDPPFNTGQAFDYYDDGLEHSIWLSMMRQRIILLHKLLSDDGTMFIHIDDNEIAYLTILLDEIFGRQNRQYLITFKQGSATGHKSINPGCVNTTNFILIYSKNSALWSPNRVYTARGRDERYGQFIENVSDNFEEWRITTLAKGFASTYGLNERVAKQQIKQNPDLMDDFVIENAKAVIQLARPNYSAVGIETKRLIDESNKNPNKIFRLERDGYSDIYLIGGRRILFYKDKLKLIDGRLVAGEPLTTLWDDILSNNLHAEGGVEFPKGKKPEALIKRIIELTTNPGDIVLDSFAGSGSTGVVAHKMGRKWIMIELRDHCHTHIIPRLQKVIDGTDQGGISKEVKWQGGGGFRYYKLAPSLLQKDKYSNWVISKEYNAEMLAEAMCKHEGFMYSPDEAVFWKQGGSTENDYIYTTTVPVTTTFLDNIVDQMGDKETLLVCCTSFRCQEKDYPQITLKRIPQAVLSRCEFGRDDYSLKISQLEYQQEVGEIELWGEDNE